MSTIEREDTPVPEPVSEDHLKRDPSPSVMRSFATDPPLRVNPSCKCDGARQAALFSEKLHQYEMHARHQDLEINGLRRGQEQSTKAYQALEKAHREAVDILSDPSKLLLQLSSVMLQRERETNEQVARLERENEELRRFRDSVVQSHRRAPVPLRGPGERQGAADDGRGGSIGRVEQRMVARGYGEREDNLL